MTYSLGADAVSIGTAALIALGDNNPELDDEYRALGSAAGYWGDYQDGTDPAGITTQNEDLSSRLDPVLAGRRLANYLQASNALKKRRLPVGATPAAGRARPSVYVG